MIRRCFLSYCMETSFVAKNRTDLTNLMLRWLRPVWYVRRVLRVLRRGHASGCVWRRTGAWSARRLVGGLGGTAAFITLCANKPLNSTI